MGSTQVETKSGLVDSGPVCRTVQDEQADFDEVVKNFSTGAYRDWPNEAGVGAHTFLCPNSVTLTRCWIV